MKIPTHKQFARLIGDNLKVLRGYSTLSIRDVAEGCEFTPAQLSNYENGKTIPSLLAAIAIADMFDVSLDYLVGRCQNSKAHKTQRLLKYKEESNHDRI